MGKKDKNVRLGTMLRLNALKKIILKFSRGKQKILDVGGFDGYISRKIKSTRPKSSFYVLDTDKKGLEIAQKNGLKVVNSSVTKIPFKSETFDLVLCLDLIEHVKKDSIMVKEISRVMKKKGILILSTPFKEGITFPFLSKSRIEEVNLSWGHVRKGYSYMELKDLFRKNRLKVKKKSKYFNILTRSIYRIIALSKVPIKGKTLIYQVVTKLEKYLKLGGQEHIFVAEKI